MVWLRCTCNRLLHHGVRYASNFNTAVKSKELKPKSKYNRRRDFIDSMRIYVRGGGGGQGLPKYGGLGGNGGDVYVTAKQKLTLKHVLDKNPSKRFIAGTGDNSSPRKLVGDAGKDCVIKVPVGIAVCDESGRVIGDLNEEKQAVRVARGGLGGTPDNGFLGQRGETTMVRLDLKLLADIGLLGFPNAGKSTFLSAISRASPKIASYPFTTIQPQIGVMHFTDHRQISVADLPGLIEGAHVNVGMGHRFLKHVERTKLLLFMVDVNGFQLPRREHFRTALETILLLNKELELYEPELLTKPAVLVVNKMDTQTDHAVVDAIRVALSNIPDSLAGIDESIIPEQFVNFDHITAISAKSGDSVADLKIKLRQILDFYADKKMYTHAQTRGRDLTEVRKDSTLDLDSLERNRLRPV